MSGIFVVVFGALLFAFGFLSLTRSHPHEMGSFILRFEMLMKDLVKELEENLDKIDISLLKEATE